MTTDKLTINGQECLRFTGMLKEVQDAVSLHFRRDYEIVPRSSRYAVTNSPINTTVLRPSRYTWEYRTRKEI